MRTQFNTTQKRLGVVRLHALEFLESVQSKLGARMRIHLKEADIYNTLTDYFEAFPYNDLALSRVYNIIATSLDCRFVRLSRE